jgi:hypothetical protein
MQEVSRDFLLREELVTDPTTLVAEYTRREKVEFATAQGAKSADFFNCLIAGNTAAVKDLFQTTES